MSEFCPHCFHLAADNERTCSLCGTDISQWDSSTQDFNTRLIQALHHPVDDVRLRAIYAIGKRGVIAAANALVECALSTPADVVQGLEIISALSSWPPSPEQQRTLERLAGQHPAKIVQIAARNALRQAT